MSNAGWGKPCVGLHLVDGVERVYQGVWFWRGVTKRREVNVPTGATAEGTARRLALEHDLAHFYDGRGGEMKQVPVTEEGNQKENHNE